MIQKIKTKMEIEIEMEMKKKIYRTSKDRRFKIIIDNILLSSEVHMISKNI